MRRLNMAAEVALTASALLKWVWVGFILPIVHLFVKQNKIDVKVNSLEIKGEQTKQLLRENTAATKALTLLVTELRIDLAGRTQARHDD